ncbi:S41 family peptidase [Nubsella zeaxanthinifaciens]|uniref:S41 family peptidase n=1 Tax=Nubsella zeaxanthinifaciens TaxID=392412 RepID=UPI000DE1D60E|nr:S41 family peptidase [Nubsella zeaxanthinifaciens]
MKTIPYHFLLLLIAVQLINASSAKAQVNITKIQNQNIKRFIQIWGLVKYKSEKSIVGEFDADKEFLSLIDSVKDADEERFDRINLKLIGQVNLSTASSTHSYQKNNIKYLLNNIDYSWIKKSRYSATLKQRLTALSNQVNDSEKHHYIPTIWYENNLPNEASYSDYGFNEQKMNLLTLAKVWNAIEYLFPYKYMTDKNWSQTLVEMVPIFRNIKDRTSYEKGLLMLAAAINDTHGGELMDHLKMTSTIFNVRYYPPFDYKVEAKGIIIEKFLNDSLAKNSALKPGDIITAIDGIKIGQWIKERAALLPASNDAVKYRELSTSNNNRGDTFAFSNLKGQTLQLQVLRNKAHLNVALKMLDRFDKESVKLIVDDLMQKREKEKKIKGMENISDDITLFRAGNFFDRNLPNYNDLEQLSAKLKSKKAIIFDMRKYPQSPGLFGYYLPLLLGKAPFAFARYYAVDLKNPGAFIHLEGIENYMRVEKDGVKTIGELYTGKIVILTDENTQSMGEWFTMMLRQFNANTTIIGSQTAGADGDVKRLTLPGAYQFSFTGNGIFYPDGRETQRIGIIPDIYFKASAKDLSGTEDAHLQRALKFIKEGK